MLKLPLLLEISNKKMLIDLTDTLCWISKLGVHLIIITCKPGQKCEPLPGCIPNLTNLKLF